MSNNIPGSSSSQVVSDNIGNITENVHSPVSNTGVVVDYNRFGLGWLSFTYHRAEGIDAYASVVHFAKTLTKFTSPHLEKTKAGVNGYAQARVYVDGVIIAWSADREDIFVNIPQTALDRIKGPRLARLLYWFGALSHFHVTRLDVYFDDYSKGLSPAVFETELLAGNYPGRATQWSVMESFDKDTLEGYTVYVGSQHSEFRVRCYDKSLESQGKYDCNRLEFQLRADTARTFFNALVYSPFPEWGQRAFSLLLSKFDFCVRSGKRNLKTSRRVQWWADFVAAADCLRWRVESKEARFIRTIAWMESALPAQLALLAELIGPVGLSDWVDAMLVDGNSRLTARHHALLADLKSQMPTK